MTRHSFDYCALHYLNQWIEKDRRFTEILRNGTRESRLFALKEAATFYRVARTLHTHDKTDDIDSRYGRLLSLLESVDWRSRRGDIVKTILRFEKRVRRQSCYKDNSVISLVTKMLWQKIQSPIIIYDANACDALNLPKDVPLKDFYKTWRVRYESCERRIIAACDRLPSKHKYAIAPPKIYDSDSVPARLSSDDIHALASQKWFRERVFDMYLWHSGADPTS